MTTCLLVSAPFGGIEPQFRLLERALPEDDRITRVEAIWLEHHPAELLSRIPPLSWNWSTAAAWATDARLRGLREVGSDPDVVMLNHVNAVTLLNPMTKLPPVVLHLDTTPLLTNTMAEQYLGRPPRSAPIERAKAAIYRRALRVPRHFVVVSHGVERSLVEDYEVDPRSISVIGFSVDLDSWPAPDRGLHADDRPVRILFVGGELLRKGGAVVLDAARRPDLSACEFHLVTKSSVADVPSNVFVHRGISPGSGELRKLFAAADVFVLPTEADLSPIVLAEAMAAGLPIVTTDVGGIAELVEDGGNGYVVPVGDVDRFADRLTRLVADPGLRRRMGGSGRARAETNHGLALNVRRIVDVLDDARQ